MIKHIVRNLLSQRSRFYLKFDIIRFKTRCLSLSKRNLVPEVDKLHFGCGSRRIDGWLNVDVTGSDFNVDLASGFLPWKDGVFTSIVAQQVIEHLDIKYELIPLLKELRRCSKPGKCEMWLACPDMEKVCRSYLEHKGLDLLTDIKKRRPDMFGLDEFPTQQTINFLFHQNGEHKNLFDFELLSWVLERSGFSNCQRVSETEFMNRFPEFPLRNDDYQSLYVKAIVE